MSLQRVVTLVEYNAFMRQPVALFWTFLYPIVLLVVMALVFGSPAPTATLRVAVAPGSAAAARIEAARPALRDAGIIVAPVKPSTAADVRLVTEPDGAATVTALTDGWQPQVFALVLSAQGTTAPVAFSRPDPGSIDYRIYLIAGVAALSVITMALFGFTPVIVGSRAAGRLRWLAFWPIGPGHYLIAFAASRIVITVIFGVALIYGFGWIYGATAIWSLSVLLAITWSLLAGAFCFLSGGLLLASVITRPTTANALVNLLNLPILFLSDFIVPLSMLPPWLQDIALRLPTTLFVRWLRSLVEQGHGDGQGLIVSAVLLAVGGVCLYAATRLFRIADT